MENLDFIIRNMRWSYSRINSFETCKYAWFLTYIKELPSINNFFSDYGLFIHSILEKYLKKELSIFELVDYYENNYKKNVKCKAPPYPKGMAERYYEDGLAYLENFEGFGELEIISVESKMRFTTEEGYEFGGYIDLIAKDTDGEYIVIDHKSSNIFKKKTTKKYGEEIVIDTTKLKGYKKQMYLYATDVKDKFGKFPKELRLNLFRMNKEHIIPFDEQEYNETIAWANECINSILSEKDFKEHISEYFCRQLCGVRKSCFKI